MNRLLSAHVFWPLAERLRGRDTMERFRQLCVSEQLDEDGLRAIQDRKLRYLTALAARHCPYYAEQFRAAGLAKADQGIGLEDLTLLPTLSRQQIRDHLEGMIWHGAPGKPFPYATGGSSGEPLRFYTDASRQAADWGARLRARLWWGVRPGDREIWVWGAPTELRAQDRLRRWRDALLNQEILSAFDMSAGMMDRYIERIRAVRPACVQGYASSIALLARHALRNRGMTPGALGSPSMRVVFVTGEVLVPADREIIGSAFGVPVVVEYGSRDAGFMALECPGGNLHVPQENMIVELLDPSGAPVGPGEIGEVVVTCLEAFAMPFIRYRIGDMARRATPGGTTAQRRCSCGLAHTALAEVRGRVTDQIVCREGDHLRRMHALSLIYILREASGLHQFQIIQHDLERLEVDIVCGQEFTREVEEGVRRQLAQRMGGDVAVDIRRCMHIPPSASGKHACVISRVA